MLIMQCMVDNIRFIHHYYYFLCFMTGARHLEESCVATELARIEKTGDAISDKSSFFFGANSADMGHLLANPNVIKLTK
jgi:hypothetical protein